jgi:Ca2+-binding EF-hand superfamily protein
MQINKVTCKHRSCGVQVQELQEVFRFFDVDGSGRISLREIDNQMNSLGFRVSLAQLRAILESLNPAGASNMELTFPGFVLAMIGQMRV